MVCKRAVVVGGFENYVTYRRGYISCVKPFAVETMHKWQLKVPVLNNQQQSSVKCATATGTLNL